MSQGQIVLQDFDPENESGRSNHLDYQNSRGIGSLVALNEGNDEEKKSIQPQEQYDFY